MWARDNPTGVKRDVPAWGFETSVGSLSARGQFLLKHTSDEAPNLSSIIAWPTGRNMNLDGGVMSFGRRSHSLIDLLAVAIEKNYSRLSSGWKKIDFSLLVRKRVATSVSVIRIPTYECRYRRREARTDPLKTCYRNKKEKRSIGICHDPFA